MSLEEHEEQTVQLIAGYQDRLFAYVLTLARIPAGRFVMGDPAGCLDENAQKVVEITKPFWMGTTEVTVAQYQRFASSHRNGYYDMHWKDQTGPGYFMDGPDLPAIRPSGSRQWLSD